MIEEFGRKYRGRVRRDRGDDTLTITGKRGDIYEYSASELGVMFIPNVKSPRPPKTRMWNKFKLEAVAAGMVLRQDGDAEGALSFDPSNETQCLLAIRIAGVRRKRQLSPEQIAKLVAAGQRALQDRSTPRLQGRSLT